MNLGESADATHVLHNAEFVVIHVDSRVDLDDYFLVCELIEGQVHLAEATLT